MKAQKRQTLLRMRILAQQLHRELNPNESARECPFSIREIEGLLDQLNHAAGQLQKMEGSK